ncbi:MAG: tRNA (uridine(34)/cytosine(34)/5-carboxymethylaminomethyluridine(34)-2'-O)-methyltransferase TrmL [Clostridiales bacterium]|nr:tRNA (uridine(34)/cytosine(34)/5-carboxymethylaminomethyluridine(34)-2'-O)-methyltransferase TrmL [Clostridiales bacterium]
MRLNIVLVEPEIPQNTGNISRTCAAIGADLHLVRPLGFSTDDRQLKRAGLDYWDKLRVFYHDSFESLAQSRPSADFYFFSTKAGKSYCDVAYADGCYIVFGKETAGLPPGLLERHAARCFRIPMREGIRSLNLSNAVAIVAYEAMRQGSFEGLAP